MNRLVSASSVTVSTLLRHIQGERGKNLKQEKNVAALGICQAAVFVVLEHSHAAQAWDARWWDLFGPVADTCRNTPGRTYGFTSTGF